jgi:nucleoid-associated protein YgaU
VKFGIFPLLVLLGLSLSGCDQFMKQQKDRALDRADQAAKDGDYQAAAGAYEDAIDGTAETAEAQYRLALIEDDKLKNTVGALAHYQRYLELAPKGTHAKDAARFVKELRFRLINELSTGAMMTQTDAAHLKNDNLELTKKNAALNAQIAELRKQRNTAMRNSSTPITPQDLKKLPPGTRTYTVQSGDTLASIARHFYKSSARWKDILDANYYGLQGKTALKVGQTLIIPE